MITGVWISPDGEDLAIQHDEDSIWILRGSETTIWPMKEGVPDEWHTLRDWSELS